MLDNTNYIINKNELEISFYNEDVGYITNYIKNILLKIEINWIKNIYLLNNTDKNDITSLTKLSFYHDLSSDVYTKVFYESKKYIKWKIVLNRGFLFFPENGCISVKAKDIKEKIYTNKNLKYADICNIYFSVNNINPIVFLDDHMKKMSKLEIHDTIKKIKNKKIETYETFQCYIYLYHIVVKIKKKEFDIKEAIDFNNKIIVKMAVIDKKKVSNAIKWYEQVKNDSRYITLYYISK